MLSNNRRNESYSFNKETRKTYQGKTNKCSAILGEFSIIYLIFCAADEVIQKEKKANKPGVGTYSIDKGKARVYWPSVRKR